MFILLVLPFGVAGENDGEETRVFRSSLRRGGVAMYRGTRWRGRIPASYTGGGIRGQIGTGGSEVLKNNDCRKAEISTSRI